MKAKALKISTYKYRSSEERAFAKFGRAIIEQHSGSKVAYFDYRPESFNLPGGCFTPSFRVILDDGTVVFVKVGKIKVDDTRQDSLSKIKTAQSTNPFYAWLDIRLSIKRGEIDKVEVDLMG